MPQLVHIFLSVAKQINAVVLDALFQIPPPAPLYTQTEDMGWLLGGIFFTSYNNKVEHMLDNLSKINNIKGCGNNDKTKQNAIQYYTV